MTTTQYRYAIHHDPPHMRPVHTFTPWTESVSLADMNMAHIAQGMRASVAAIDTYILCKPGGEPCGSAELQTREAPEATGEGAAESKADALEQRAYMDDDAKWAERDRLYLARRTDAAAYDRAVQEVKEARE